MTLMMFMIFMTFTTTPSCPNVNITVCETRTEICYRLRPSGKLVKALAAASPSVLAIVVLDDELRRVHEALGAVIQACVLLPREVCRRRRDALIPALVRQSGDGLLKLDVQDVGKSGEIRDTGRLGDCTRQSTTQYREKIECTPIGRRPRAHEPTRPRLSGGPPFDSNIALFRIPSRTCAFACSCAINCCSSAETCAFSPSLPLILKV